MERSSKGLRDVGLALKSASHVQGPASGHYAGVGNDSTSSLGAHLDPRQESTSHLERTGEETLCEECIIDPTAVATLREFFELLDEWDSHNNRDQTRLDQRR